MDTSYEKPKEPTGKEQEQSDVYLVPILFY